MPHELNRRFFVNGLGAALVLACAPRAPAQRAHAGAAVEPASDVFAELEARVGGRVGVFALDTGSGRILARRADERFALCSTFKWLLAAALLVRVDRGELLLAREVPYGADDLLEYAPVTRANLGRGSLSVEELARAAVLESDNTAANLLLPLIDGPAGLTRFCREIGDGQTRLDRNEPSLNGNLPGDARDTTTPRAMALDVQAVLTGNILSAASRERLIGWLEMCRTGNDRLRAGLPASWRAGHKTGTGERGAVNDVTICWPPGRAPIVIAAYLSESSASLPVLSSVHAEIARIIAMDAEGAAGADGANGTQKASGASG